MLANVDLELMLNDKSDSDFNKFVFFRGSPIMPDSIRSRILSCNYT